MHVNPEEKRVPGEIGHDDKAGLAEDDEEQEAVEPGAEEAGPFAEMTVEVEEEVDSLVQHGWDGSKLPAGDETSVARRLET